MKEKITLLSAFAIVTALSVTSVAMPVFATASYSSPPYAQAVYGAQWTVSGVTTSQTVTIQNGAAGRIWQVYQVNNVGSVPLNKAIVTFQVIAVEVGGTWYASGPNLALVRLLNSNGVFTTTKAQVQSLGTIDAGSDSQHVLNVAYDSSVQKFYFQFLVWYNPS
ncbi:MAG: hypothetical protein JRN57_04470 [Nitrososphaerota archaeon]|nr:hypothetical protein [Nitrososphaerota archaeon]